MKAYAAILSLAFLPLLMFPQRMTGQDTATHAVYKLSGRVSDYTGTPRRGKLQAYRLAVQDGQTAKYSGCTTESGADGQFTCDGLETGSYIVQVLLYPKSFQDNSTPPKDPSSILYYPGVTDLNLAEVISVGNVSQTWCDIRVPPLNTFKISGSLQGIPNTADLRLEAMGRDVSLDTQIHLLRDPQKQVFYADHVPNGRYLVSAVWRDKEVPRRMTAELAVNNTDQPAITLHEDPLISLHGVVAGELGDVTTLLLYRKDNSSLKKIVPVDQGKFIVPPVPEGEYYFALPVHSRGFVSEIDRDGVTTEGSDIRVSSSDVNANIQVKLAISESAIVGSIASKPSPNNRLRVVAVNDMDKHVFTAIADAQDRFSLTGLTPGEYTLLAWPAAEDPPYRTPRVLQKLAKYGTTASVDEHGQVIVNDLSPVDISTLQNP